MILFAGQGLGVRVPRLHHRPTSGNSSDACANGSRIASPLRAGSSAFAPAAHGGLPPVSYPVHRPSLAGRRHTRRARASAGKGHPPGGPVLSRARSPSRALAALASHAMALRATLDCDLPRSIGAYRKDGQDLTARRGGAPRHAEAWLDPDARQDACDSHRGTIIGIAAVRALREEGRRVRGCRHPGMARPQRG